MSAKCGAKRSITAELQGAQQLQQKGRTGAFRQGGNLRLHDFIVVLLWFHRIPPFYQV
ncbi:MAG: hypothetical protein ACLUO4_08915 [Christensenellales bacterium]